jgi:hypothetical protein
MKVSERIMKNKRFISLLMALLLVVALVPTYASATASPGLFSWSAQTTGTTNPFNSVSYGNGKFLAVTPHDFKIWASNDGTSWSNSTTLTDQQNPYKIDFVNNKFMALGNGNDGDDD